jgi:hypothetical protein
LFAVEVFVSLQMTVMRCAGVAQRTFVVVVLPLFPVLETFPFTTFGMAPVMVILCEFSTASV